MIDISPDLEAEEFLDYDGEVKFYGESKFWINAYQAQRLVEFLNETFNLGYRKDTLR